MTTSSLELRNKELELMNMIGKTNLVFPEFMNLPDFQRESLHFRSER
jgi:hypothetical protein